jgi:ADP-heptose:LPS heptosyltransferase
MSRTPVKYTPKYIISEAIKWTEYGLQQGLIRLLRWVLPRRKASLHQVDFRTAKVLFLRQNQIGDALISTPIFAALKRHYPAMTIDVLLDRRNAVALEANPHIRKRYIIKQKKLDILSAIHSIRKERYDIVVDLVHSASSTSTLICLCCNAKVIMGFERPNDFLYDERSRCRPTNA